MGLKLRGWACTGDTSLEAIHSLVVYKTLGENEISEARIWDWKEDQTRQGGGAESTRPTFRGSERTGRQLETERQQLERQEGKRGK